MFSAARGGAGVERLLLLLSVVSVFAVSDRNRKAGSHRLTDNKDTQVYEGGGGSDDVTADPHIRNQNKTSAQYSRKSAVGNVFRCFSET